MLLQGRFEILSLSGSFMPTDNNQGTRSRAGGMSVSLASPDGRVVGGGVAGVLIAATPVQVNILSLFTLRSCLTMHQFHTYSCSESEPPFTLNIVAKQIGLGIEK